ncbi:hypothetical protein BGZ81_003864, partial [Podila clonocystis]
PFIVNRNLTYSYIFFQGCTDKESQVGSSSIPSDSIIHFTSLHGCSHDDDVESPFKNLAQTLLARNSGPSSFDAPLQELTHKMSKSQLDATKTLQSSVIPKLKAVKEIQWTTYAAPVVSKSNSPFVLPLKKPPVNDILFERGKENQPPRTALISQPSSSRSHNTTSFNGSSEMKTPKHDRSGQAKAGGFATASIEGNYVKPRSKAVASEDDDDFMPSRVTTKNVPTGKRLPTKKQRQSLAILVSYLLQSCGKTRAVIELLSQHWGFYFNATDDDWGSGDTMTLYGSIRDHLKDLQASYTVMDLEANNAYARKITLLLFLSRLLVFKYCISVPGSSVTFTSARWALLQVCPHVLFKDVFNALFLKLLDLQHHGLNPLSLLVRNVYDDAKDRLVERGCLPAIKDNTRLLVINGEAQFFGDQFNSSFQSMTSSNESPRPILSPILHACREISASISSRLSRVGQDYQLTPFSGFRAQVL